MTEDGFANVSHFGTRHIDDLVFWPDRDVHPSCWIRVCDDVADKLDKVVQEVVLYPHNKAQAAYRRFILETTKPSLP